MTVRARIKRRLAALWRDDQGATLVEFGIVISLFLLIFFALIDFGRLAYHVVTSERATHAALRIAAVRPPACPGLPEFLERDAASAGTVLYGTSCNAGGPICADPGTVTCVGSSTNPTAVEAWAVVETFLPPDAQISNLRFTYAYDPNLGFLGGPYVPVVTVELENVGFDFVTPLSALAELAGAAPGGTAGNSLTLPTQSVSMPAEDLAHGENG